MHLHVQRRGIGKGAGLRGVAPADPAGNVTHRQAPANIAARATHWPGSIHGVSAPTAGADSISRTKAKNPPAIKPKLATLPGTFAAPLTCREAADGSSVHSQSASPADSRAPYRATGCTRRDPGASGTATPQGKRVGIPASEASAQCPNSRKAASNAAGAAKTSSVRNTERRLRRRYAQVIPAATAKPPTVSEGKLSKFCSAEGCSRNTAGCASAGSRRDAAKQLNVANNPAFQAISGSSPQRAAHRRANAIEATRPAAAARPNTGKRTSPRLKLRHGATTLARMCTNMSDGREEKRKDRPAGP